MAVSEEKILQRSRRRGQIFQQPFSLLESAQTLAGIAFEIAGNQGRICPAASKFAGKPFQQGISDSHSLLEFSERCFKGSLHEGASLGMQLFTYSWKLPA